MLSLRLPCRPSPLRQAVRNFGRDAKHSRTRATSAPRRTSLIVALPVTALALAGLGYIGFQSSQNFRHTVLAVTRCSRIGEAAILSVVDYKLTFGKSYKSEEEKLQAYSECHTCCANRVLKALLANGGIFIKLGQHLSSLVMLPTEWRSALRPLQDQCEATPLEGVERLFQLDMGVGIDSIFEDFDPQPIGVASLAQVHVTRYRQSGQKVAVKLQHPHLDEFCQVDMEMVEVTLGWIKYWFPEFEFTWLGEEMRENLPKEMDFRHEAANAQRAEADFENIRTSLYIPRVIEANKRVLIMEYIQGGRVDDLEYLAEARIDRNKVALELSRIFNQMVFVNGWFHADPHPGNLLIRPAPATTKSPYNFEIVLLDHGLYFDLDTPLRVNYGKFWLALIAPANEETKAERRKYAQLVGNIGPELYPIFEAAMTGRAGLEGTFDDDPNGPSIQRASGLIEASRVTEEEVDLIRHALVTRDGMFTAILHVLRRVPRRVLMVLKLNDLLRGLDSALATTHGEIRIFLIMAKYCAVAVWRDDRNRIIDTMRSKGLFSITLLKDYFGSWWRYQKRYASMALIEVVLDTQARIVVTKAWFRGLMTTGLSGARLAASGLA
ncbi:ABC1-domain-containing protein [Cylindrobasidium torrendii FP15055 ss-10]|uniref:ABC1-domain-containing protein n=1 Tax=Cylindrobasidium torrendii FP15055 ss-10 TaxID=1314674 RepID=A0A0D7BTT2_9AGAR|nr:ABC1-domain-containing protein [Cylindrobasidium torrendii FP15055 ss-10]